MALERSARISSLLLVDDDPGILYVLEQKLLEKFNVRLMLADSGNAAADALLKFPFDLVVSDVQMPKGTGIWLHKFMKRATPHIPLIFFTSSPENTLPPPDEILRANIAKFDFASLAAAIRGLGLASKNNQLRAEMNRRLGPILQKARMSNGQTLREAAAALGLPVHELIRIEKRPSEISCNRISRTIKHYGPNACAVFAAAFHEIQIFALQCRGK